MKNIELKAIRQGLGLEVARAAELAGVTKRTFQYWEAGRTKVPSDVASTFLTMASHYTMIIYSMRANIHRATIYNDDDDTKPSALKPVLPYYHEFEQFKAATGCSHVVYWRIYQSVISHLLLMGRIVKLDDDAIIPPNFEVWRWLRGEYEHDVD